MNQIPFHVGKNIAGVIFLFIFLLFIVFFSTNWFWVIIFLGGLAYSIYALDQWQKGDKDFNIYILLSLFILSQAFFFFALFSIVLSNLLS
ncbi:hypothetical protein [Alkalibacillus aidingensis]|uniref:hypothetical protein n=1 Tax=Alkalibacillus aidingensis TaxID=2747607 RepID=UPI0016616DD9|nr:hypothetical protein [Alkalibacillus aidingensis]